MESILPSYPCISDTYSSAHDPLAFAFLRDIGVSYHATQSFSSRWNGFRGSGMLP